MTTDDNTLSGGGVKFERKHSIEKHKAYIRSNHQGLGWHLTGHGEYVNAALHMLGHVPTLITFFGIMMGGYWNWLTCIVGWILVPLFDLIIGADSYNLTDAEEKRWKDFIGFRIVTWFHLPLQISLLTFCCWVISAHELTGVEWYGMLFSVGTAQGFGIGCVHEMLHNPHVFDCTCSMLSLCFSSYGHFWIEHLWAHHRKVATDLDCASSSVGDVSWFFVPKCMITTAIEAWNIEAKIMRMKKKHPLNPLYNRYIIAWMVTGLIAYTYATLFGKEVLSFFFLQGLIAGYIVDNTNYVEHYGLRRHEYEPGQFEVVGWLHSWDTPDLLTNYMLFKIQRHPDHHTNAARPYQILRTFKDAPTLPTGYAGMIVLSWFPPLWRAVMDWRAELAQEQAKELRECGTVNGEKYIFPDGARAVASHFKEEDKLFLQDAKMYQNAGKGVVQRSTTTKPKNDRGLKRVNDELEHVAGRYMSLFGLLIVSLLVGEKMVVRDWPGRFPEMLGEDVVAPRVETTWSAPGVFLEHVLKRIKNCPAEDIAAGTCGANAMAPLLERMGGDEVIRPMCNSIYNAHLTDPLTSTLFKDLDDAAADETKRMIYELFSTGIGGPHQYTKKVSRAAMNALQYHHMTQMEKFAAGSSAEREEVMMILKSLEKRSLIAA